MHEGHLDERVQGLIGILGGVTESLQEHVNQALDFRVANDFAETLETAVRRIANLLVCVVKDNSKGRDNGWQTDSQLLWIEISHSSQKLTGSLLTAPLRIVQSVQKCRQDLLHTVGTKVLEASL